MLSRRGRCRLTPAVCGTRIHRSGPGATEDGLAEVEKKTDKDAAKRVRGAAAVVGGLTLGSRLLGFWRDVLFGRLFFGAGLDAWALAFTVPNLFRRLFGEGALSSAFQPIYVEKLEEGDDEGAGRFAGNVITSVGLILAVIVAAGVLLCLVISALVPDGPARILRLTSAMLPYALMICLAAVYSAVLNGRRHFATPAAAPAVLNILIIAAVLIFGRSSGGLWWLVGAVLIGGVAQLAMQIFAARAKGAGIKLGVDRRDPDLGRVVERMMPAALGLAVFQINVLLDRVIAQVMVPGEGAVSVLYLANRVVQLPLALFAIAAATAAMPELSSAAARKDLDGLRKLTADSIRGVLFWALPACAGLAILGRPIARFLFEYLGGEKFSAVATERTGLAIAFYAAGLCAFAVTPILSRAFHAQGDTKTPARVAALCVGANLALNIILVLVFHSPRPAGAAQDTATLYLWGESGLALASAISFLLQAGMLAALLWRRDEHAHTEWAAVAIEPFASVAAAVGAGVLLYHPIIPLVYGKMLRPFFGWTHEAVYPWTRLVMALAAAGAVFLIVMFGLLSRRTRDGAVKELFASVIRLGVSAAAMGGLVHLVLWSLPPFKRSAWQPFDRAFFPVVAGFLFYWLVVSVFRVTEYEEFRGLDGGDDDDDGKKKRKGSSSGGAS